MANLNKTITDVSIATMRTLTIDSVERAQHGHPGMPLGAAPMAYTLWKKFLNINPKNPMWFDRDRFVLSAGHGSMLLYNLLHLSGFDLSLDDLKGFRQLDSKTPGHPEYGYTPGVEATTGPLGQGIPVSVGMALAERHLADTYNRPGYPIVGHYTYTICGDGDLMEGVSSEAASFAGHLGLGNLIVLFDSNDTCLDGTVSDSFSEDVRQRFEAYNWQYLYVADGNDVNTVERAIATARHEKNKPTIIEIKTVIGYGAPSVQGTHDAHSDPLGKDEIKRTKAFLQWDYEDEFHIPEEVYEDFSSIQKNGAEKEAAWNELFSAYQKEYPEQAKQLKMLMDGKLQNGWSSGLPVYTAGDKLATRVAASETLNALSVNVPSLVGGSADLNSSTKTHLKAFGDMKSKDFSGRNIKFGVREFAMGAIANGLALHGLRPFVSTFFVFSDYLRPAIRLASLMKLPVTYVFTHDSIAVGQDGPTHEPVEHLASFRAMPGISVIRPADANETREAWVTALKQQDRPTMLVLGRQGITTLDETAKLAEFGVSKGAYIVSPASQEPSGILIAAGSEVQLAVDAQRKLAEENIHVNVVSMPSWDLFGQQSDEYKASVLPPHLQRRLTIEMGSKMGWRDYAGCKGQVMSVDTFGVSGPGEQVIEKYGFTVENVVIKYKNLLD
ncbi:transketolase [Virgibacillus halophilus]|uniref:Transketolase n=1 Tax=Tigheibacillus halophilus TaxID=361280 RepID=A0ABU5C345_9BACI|nr:transketolase [Virgibacillus halophilus]